MWRLLILSLAACADTVAPGRDARGDSASEVSQADVDAVDGDTREDGPDVEVSAGDTNGDANSGDAGGDANAGDASGDANAGDAISDANAGDADVSGADGDGAAPDGNDAALGVTRCVRGRLMREARRPKADGTGLLPIEAVPVDGLEVAVRGARAVSRSRTDAAGLFEVCGLERDTPLELRVEAAVPRDDQEAPALAVLDGADIDVPQRRGVPIVGRRLWAWSRPLAADTPDALDDWLIAETEGSGALAILAEARAVIGLAQDDFAERALEAPTLGIVWSPSRTPSCLSCYLPAAWGPLVLAASPDTPALTFARALFLSGAPSAPHHWTPSLVAHELGHYVMDTWSVLADLGGPHGWDARVEPALAWSEGFATFFAQRALSTPEAVAPRFFTIQSGIAYWVDLGAIGRPPRDDDTSLPFLLPLPDPSAALTQRLGEAAVAAVLWGLWSQDPGGGARVLDASASTRMRTLDRGAPGPDLVDLLDAFVCADPDLAPDAITPSLLDFPYDFEPLCP